jgi:transposase
MFVRTKKSPKTNKTAVQIVKAVRKDGKVSQKIIRHVGMALSDEELKRLLDLAEYIKANLESEYQLNLFPAEEIAERAIRAREEKQDDGPLPVNLKELREEQRVTIGIHDIYSVIYKELGFDTLLGSPKRKVAVSKALYNIVMARIASPGSKRRSVKLLEDDFGVRLRLDTVYQMMDLFDEDCIEKLKKKTYRSASDLFGGKLDVVFYDCTTLYFESFKEDDFRKNGYSKDKKFNQPQVLLAILVTTEGLPVSYEVYTGNTFEGHTLSHAIEELREKYSIKNVVFVSDSALLSKDNLKFLESKEQGYIVGARLRNTPNSVQEKILDRNNYIEKSAEESIFCLELDENRRLIVSYNKHRAHKDRLDREEALERLKKRLEKSKNPVNLISNYGYKKYIKIEGESQLEINEEKLEKEQCWDGLHGMITNRKDIPAADIISQYHGLWQIEESFRITKHDLRIRPIYHWTPRRVKAHIAICFMALTCVRHLEYRVARQYKKLSPEVIRNDLLHIQLSILKDIKNNRYYALPSSLSEHTRNIYKVVGKRISTVPYEIK